MKLLSLQKLIDNCPELYKIFKNCPAKIIDHCNLRRFQAGEIVHNQGEICNTLSIIVEGYVDIYLMAENGKKYSPRIMTTGDLIGEMELFEQRPLLCYIEALTNLQLIQIKRNIFMEWLELDRNICFYLIEYTNKRFCFFAQKASEDTLYSLKTRVYRFLLYWNKELINNSSLKNFEINKKKLSERFGVTPRSINRILRYLKEKDIIEVNNTSIIIKDLQRLSLEEETSRYL